MVFLSTSETPRVRQLVGNPNLPRERPDKDLKIGARCWRTQFGPGVDHVDGEVARIVGVDEPSVEGQATAVVEVQEPDSQLLVPHPQAQVTPNHVLDMIDDTPRLGLELEALRRPILFELLNQCQSLSGGDVSRVWGTDSEAARYLLGL